MESWWDLRKARHAEYMELMIKGQIRRRREQKEKEDYNQQMAMQMSALSASAWNTSAAAKMQLVDYLRDGKLQKIFGDTVGASHCGSHGHCAIGDLAVSTASFTQDRIRSFRRAMYFA